MDKVRFVLFHFLKLIKTKQCDEIEILLNYREVIAICTIYVKFVILKWSWIVDHIFYKLKTG